MPPRAATLLVRTQVRNHLVGVALASLHGRVLPTTEVQVPGLHGATWLRQQRPANLACLDALPGGGQVVQPHPGGACESSLNNPPNSTKMQAHAFSKRCGGQAVPKREGLWQFHGCCLGAPDRVAEWSTNISTNLNRGPQQNRQWRLGALSGAGCSHVLMHSATTATMRSGRRAPWVCAYNRTRCSSATDSRCRTT